MFENGFGGAQRTVFSRLRHSDLSRYPRVLELHVAAFLVSLPPAGGFKQLDNLVAGHGRIIHTNTHVAWAAGVAPDRQTLALVRCLRIFTREGAWMLGFCIYIEFGLSDSKL